MKKAGFFKHNTKSVFFSSMMQYIVLIIVVFFVNVLIINMLNKYIENQQGKIGTYIVNEIKTEFDMCIERQKNAVYKIGANLGLGEIPDIKSSEITNEDHYKVTEFSDIMYDSVNFDGYTLDVGIYYSDYDIVVSNKGIWTSKNYFETMYGKGNENYYNWLENVKSANGYFVYDSIKDGEQLVYALDYSDKGRFVGNAIAFAQMDVSVFLDKMNNIRETTDANVIVYDQSKQIVISGNTVSDARRFIETDEASIVKQSVKSADDVWNYTVCFDKREYAKDLTRIIIIEVVVIAVALIITLLYASYVSSRFSNRLKKVTGKIFNKSGMESRVGNEVTLIESGIDELMEKNLIYDYENSKNIDTIKKQVMTNMLTGFYSKSDVSLFERYYEKLNRAGFVVGIAEVTDGYDSSAGDVLRPEDIEIVFVNIITELINDIYSGEVIAFNNKFYCIMAGDEFNREDITGIFARAKEYIYQYFKIRFSVAVSPVAAGCEELSCAAHNAENLVHMHSGETDEIVFFDDLCRSESKAGSLKNVQQMLINHINSSDYESAYEIFEQWLKAQVIRNENIGSICAGFISYMSYVAGFFDSNGYSGIMQRFDPVRNIMPCGDITVLKEKVRIYFKDMADFVSDNKQKQGLDDAICEYINENFSDPGLTVAKIGEVLGFHSVYLSRVFKEKRNMTILEYVTKVRTDYAKKLLKQTDDTISVIAEKSGYVSVNTFNRIFKKSEGLSPGAYRKN